jgi:gentisate 1,2-dioxygenase
MAILTEVKTEFASQHLAVGEKSNEQQTSELLTQLESTNTLPLWAQMSKLNPPAPNPTCVPHIWKYDEIKPYLLRAGELITEKQAERRVLMLVNPARGRPPTSYGV